MSEPLKKGEIREPYQHDCDHCKWVGWFSPWSDKPPMNVYYHPYSNTDGSVIIRFSDEPSDYWSHRIGDTVKGAIQCLG